MSGIGHTIARPLPLMRHINMNGSQEPDYYPSFDTYNYDYETTIDPIQYLFIEHHPENNISEYAEQN